MIKAQLLGEFQVQVGGQPLYRFRTHKSAQMLAYLLRYPERHPRERLRALFWGELPYDAAQNNLRVSLAHLRRLLEPSGIPAGSVLWSDRRCVGLNPSAIETDVAAFERAIQQAEQAETASERLRLLKEARCLYQDEFLKGFSEPWVLVERERLQQQFHRMMQQLQPPASISGGSPRATPTPNATFPSGLGLVLGIESEEPLSSKRSWIEQVLRVCHGGCLELSASAFRAFFSSLHNLLKALDVFSEALPNAYFALDVGELRYTLGRYSGLPLETVEQLLRVGSSGQILCSERVALLLPQIRSAPRFGSHHLGCFRLGGRAGNEQIYQLDRAGHERTYPPLRALSPIQRHLVAAPTAFIGREIECSLLQTWLQNHPGGLMTLVGAPGVGKSRLMLETAWQSEALFGQAVWWITLQKPADSPPELLARQLGWPWQGLTPLATRLNAVLEGQPALLLIDAALHLSQEQTAALQQLKLAIPSLSCMVASQSPTGLEDEQCYFIEPLSLPQEKADSVEELMRSSAVRLFVERAQRAAPTFRLTKHNVEFVRKLSLQLEGLPLAIELTAARVANYSLEEIAHQLNHSLEWAKTRPSGTLSHSLYASLEAAYRDLPQEAKQLLQYLSCFKGKVSRDAIGAVFSSSNADDVLQCLTRASLLLRENGHYRMLNVVRSFVQQQIPSDAERQRMHLTCLQYHIQFVQKMQSSSPTWSQLEQERSNYESALEWGVQHAPTEALQLVNALAPFWERCGCGQTTEELIQALIQQLSSPEARLQAARLLLELAIRRGESKQATETLKQFLPVAEFLAETESAVRFWITTGFYYWMQGQIEQSIQYLQRATRLADILDAPLEKAEALNHLGVALWIKEDLDGAACALEEALEIASPERAPVLRFKALSNLANVLHQRQEHSQAEACLVSTLQLARQTGDRRTIATLLTNWSVWLREQGEYARARELCTQAAALWQELNEGIGEAATLNNLADIALHEKDLTTASTLFTRSLQCILRYRLLWYLPKISANLAEVAALQGDLQQAIQWQTVRLYTSLCFSQESHITDVLDKLIQFAIDSEDSHEACSWYSLRCSLTDQPIPDCLFNRLKNLVTPCTEVKASKGQQSTLRQLLMKQLFPTVEQVLAPFCTYSLRPVLLCE